MQGLRFFTDASFIWSENVPLTWYRDAALWVLQTRTWFKVKTQHSLGIETWLSSVMNADSRWRRSSHLEQRRGPRPLWNTELFLFGDATFVEREPCIWVHWHASGLDWPQDTLCISRPTHLLIKGATRPFKNHHLTLLSLLTLRSEFASFFKFWLEPKASSF